MKGEKRDFNQAAATWDEEPRRARLADDTACAISDEIALTCNMDVLDFGCGTGLLTLRLQPFVRSITGLDSSHGMLNVLDAKIRSIGLPNVTTRLIHLDEGDTIEGSYHLITSSMAFHHIRDIPPLLDQFHRVLVPFGYLCIADLDLDDGQFHGGNNDGVFHDGFDRSELRRMFIGAGFDDIRDRTAATVVKPVPGGTRPFTIFLMTGRKKT
jgi:cyclopropane fatty-acyl-phospholipid synthase-like methyltransferase